MDFLADMTVRIGFEDSSSPAIRSKQHSNLNPYHADCFNVLHSSPIDLQEYSYYQLFTSRAENSVDPDQLASQKPADLDLHCFKNVVYLS